MKASGREGVKSPAGQDMGKMVRQSAERIVIG
jgi:hypothetical protein